MKGDRSMVEKAFDFKKEYKDLYMPKDKPALIEVPKMKFIMTDGSGDPNGNPSFEQAVELLYGLSYAIKMSKMKGEEPAGYFDYVVPPLEGLWWVEDGEFSLIARGNWKWTLMIRQPDFVTEEVFSKACEALKKKKPEMDVERAYFGEYDEGLCVQAMHFGPYAEEPATMEKIEKAILESGLASRLGSGGKHHEIYLSDPRKADPASMKTVLRHPVERAKPTVSAK